MRLRRVGAAAAAATSIGFLASTAATAQSSPPSLYTVTSSTLHATGLGLDRNVACDLVYDLYVPNPQVQMPPYPAILTTNGFGGSKAGQADQGKFFASHGYEVLSYSGLGFGGSSCDIETDSPEWDGRAASQFVSLLGNRPEVLKDGPDDPRIGTWGGSYGGGFQFALAAVDPRIDTMIPIITWNDLAYSLTPNNDSANFNYGSSPPGVEKYEWDQLFFADGNAQPALNPGESGWTNTQGAPFTGNPPNPACPGFDATVCKINTESVAASYPTPDTIAFLRHASAQYELFNNPKAHVPSAMLVQGETDTLFDFADAVANYRGFMSRGAPAKLVFEAAGHSGPSASGEYDWTDASKGYLTQLMLNWYEHQLKGRNVSTGPNVEFFRDWVTYSGSAQPAYASASSWPVSPSGTMFLSGDGTLVTGRSALQAGSQTFISPPAAVPSSYSETSNFQGQTNNAFAPSDPPGAYAAFTSHPLGSDTISVGIPTADFTISATGTSSVDASTDVVLFGKIYDVAPDGSVTLVHRLVAPVRVAAGASKVHINLPGVAHLYPRGHQLRLVIATTDQAYVGSRAPHTITISSSRTEAGVLRIPILSGSLAATGATTSPAARPLASTVGAATAATLINHGGAGSPSIPGSIPGRADATLRMHADATFGRSLAPTDGVLLAAVLALLAGLTVLLLRQRRRQ